MKVIKCMSIAHAQERGIKEVLEHGRIIETEDGELTAMADPIVFVLDNPTAAPAIHRLSRYKFLYCEDYARQLWEGVTNEFDYDYNKCLRHAGVNGDIDQIQVCIDRLRENPTTRRALASTWSPDRDCVAKNPPCLQNMHFWLRKTDDGKNKLDLKIHIRSNCMTAMPVNAYGFTRYQQIVAEILGVSIGTYMHDSDMPHLYLRNNYEEIVTWIADCGIVPNPAVTNALDRISRSV